MQCRQQVAGTQVSHSANEKEHETYRRAMRNRLSVCHGLSIACLIGNRVSPLVRCDNLSYTSCYTLTGLSLHSVTVYIYIAPFVYSYSISSILQFFLHTRCSQTGTLCDGDLNRRRHCSDSREYLILSRKGRHIMFPSGVGLQLPLQQGRSSLQPSYTHAVSYIHTLEVASCVNTII